MELKFSGVYSNMNYNKALLFLVFMLGVCVGTVIMLYIYTLILNDYQKILMQCLNLLYPIDPNMV